MKLLVVSDFHGNFVSVEKTRIKAESEDVDGIIVCGDITHFGDLSTAEKILERLTVSGIQVIFVPGNCDPKELASKDILKGALCIHGKHRKVIGLEFVGVGGSTIGPFKTPLEISEKVILTLLNTAYDGLNDKKKFILISHSPPLNTKVDLTQSCLHAGSSAIRQFIEEKKPIVALCGHIHEARGVDKIKNTLIVNPGPAMWGQSAVIRNNRIININLSSL